MNVRAIRYYLGHITWIEAAFMVPALIISLARGETDSSMAFLKTIGLMGVLCLALFIKTKNNHSLYAREGLVIVALSWILLSFLGALPFVFSGAATNFMDAWFETVSGFTTTGATIFNNVEVLPYGLLYWRSFTHWLGGMGVLVFLLAIVPLTGYKGASLHVLRAESPGPQVGKLAPRMRQSVGILYSIYVGMTVLEVIMLLLGGMPFFDAVTTAFGTAGTGGFSVRNASLAAYDSYYLQTVVSVFMMLFGVNFTVYFLIIMRRLKAALKSEELRLYLLIIAAATIVIALNILPMYGSFFDALHHSYFQVSSIITTTGFATVDFNLWPELSRMLLLLLMIIGACAGSTGGGIKVSRLLISIKTLRSSVKHMVHPRSVSSIKIDGKVVERETVQGIGVFIFAYIAIIVISVAVIAVDNFSMETNLSAVLACINNIGPGLDMVGPTGNFAMFSNFSKFILSIDMLLGRLEIFPLLVMLAPSMWKNR